MNNLLLRLILISLLLLLVLAPFAGFALLMLVLLIAGVIWFLGSLLKILLFGNKNSKPDSQ